MPRLDDLSHLRYAIRKGPLDHKIPDFSERVRLRQEAGLSRREVAQLLGVSERAIWLWESSKDPRNVGHPRTYRRLLQALREHRATTADPRWAGEI